jgi:hypothetical protein
MNRGAVPFVQHTALRDPPGSIDAPVEALVQIFALQPHLHIEFEVIFLAVCAYRIVDLKLLIVFIHFELAAVTSLGLDGGGEFYAFVLSNLAIGERGQGRNGEYRQRRDQAHGRLPPDGFWNRARGPISSHRAMAMAARAKLECA